MRGVLMVLGLGAVLLAGQSPGDQEPETCQPELDSVLGRGVRRELGRGRFHFFAGGGVYFHCIGQTTRFRADSVASYSELNRFDLFGGVHFEDSVSVLDADRAQYFTGDERLETYGNVRLANRETGSRLSGPHLTYYRASPGVRDTTELYADRSPVVEYRDAPDTAAAWVIHSARVRMRGDVTTWAAGGVTVERENFKAASDSAELQFDRDEGLLVGHARAEGRDSLSYVVEGSQLAFRLANDALVWVQAQGNGRASSEDWRILGDTIEFDVDRDLIQGGGVWGDSTRSQAISVTYTITADSLALDAPDQVLTEVRGFGNGYATSVTESDSTAPDPDWIAADTIVARFDSIPGGGRELVLLEATGKARAYYHVPDQTDPTRPPAINYSRGARITARFRDEELQEVVIEEAGDGVYLEPTVGRRP